MIKVLMVLALLVSSGCAYNETMIVAHGNVYCTANVDKPVSVTPSLQADGNTVPLVP